AARQAAKLWPPTSDIWDGDPRVEQVVAPRLSGSNGFDVQDQVSHGQLDRVAHGVDTAIFGGKIWMVGWLQWPYQSYSVVAKDL
ncbi:MAG: hypothetical protein KAI47_18985, partial [Deltaproteobacteria bacterium]|nr:hypothetical protein [Deltaproteobacteria bacterium]